MLRKMVYHFMFVTSFLSSAQVESDIYLDDNDESRTVAGVLTANQDLFTRTTSFDFSQAFFKRRGLPSDQRSVMLNGVLMNKLNDGRANWSNWGGLNDALRNQELDQGLAPSRFYLGKLGGILNMNSFARLYSKGLKMSLAASNRSYVSRLMMTYGSRWSKRRWKFNVSGSARIADQGYREGTPYKAFSWLLSADKWIDEHHYINGTAILAHSIRGMSAALTREVFQMKGGKYNPYWGFQEGIKRNARLKSVFEPIFQFNYRWLKDSETSLRANVTCQFGFSGRSRLEYGGSRYLKNTSTIVGGGANPDPTYYQKLPSYFLRDGRSPDYTGAFLAGQNLVQDGQIDWLELYGSNINSSGLGNSIYALYEDRIDDLQLTFQVDFNTRISERLELSSSLSGRLLESSRYAFMLDLLGGEGFLDIDPFDKGVEEAQSDLRNPNRKVKEKDRFKYDYEIASEDFISFLRFDYRWKKQEIFLAGGVQIRRYRRTGKFENGSYPGKASFGKGPLLRFNTLNLKIGMTHKFNGRHLVQIFTALLQEPPNIKDSYSNIRENHDPVVGLSSKSSAAIEFNYQLRLPRIRSRLATYFANNTGGSRVSFYYADGLTGLEDSGTSAFVHEVMTGIENLYLGTEISFDFSLTDELRLKGVASLGLAEYAGNPNLYITSDEWKDPVFYGPSFLKGYRIPNGPQSAVSLGFEYSDPRYWWVGVSANWFDNSFVQVAPVTRTKNFVADFDGLVKSGYDESLARELLRQEKIPSFGLLNIVGGKSWKIKGMYLGFFASVNNVLNTKFKTGGYEQSRNANYETLLKDRNREFPLFSPKYWYGYGTTFFASLYLRSN